MTHNIEDIKGFVRSQIDASVHLSGPLSQRSFEIIVRRAIKHFDLPPTTEIEIIRPDQSPQYDIQIALGIDAPPAKPESQQGIKPKTKKPTSQALVSVDSDLPSDPSSPIDGGAGGS
jgi:hypothetical protein